MPHEAAVGASAGPVEASQGRPLPASRGAPWTRAAAPNPHPPGKKLGGAARDLGLRASVRAVGAGARCAWVEVRLGVLPILKAQA